MKNHSTASRSSVFSGRELSNRNDYLLGFIAFCAVIWLGAGSATAQNSIPEFQKILREKAAFNESDFIALGQGETVVRLLPIKDKNEVAVCGLVRLQTLSESSQSFRKA